MRALTSQRRCLLLATCAALGLVLVGRGHIVARVVYNPSPSAPRGWYAVVPAHGLKVDDYVLVELPSGPKRLADQRHYLPQSVPLLKRIEAVSDQFVCVRGRSLWIDGRVAATAVTRDGRGRELVAWQGCRVLASDELLLISRDNSASFDSRYFGPIRTMNVIGKASPLWTW